MSKRVLNQTNILPKNVDVSIRISRARRRLCIIRHIVNVARHTFREKYSQSKLQIIDIGLFSQPFGSQAHFRQAQSQAQSALSGRKDVEMRLK
jgi:hypothetical protein